MTACWSVNPDDRPNFTQLAEVFGNMLHASVTEVRTSPNSRVNKRYMFGKNAAKWMSLENSMLLLRVGSSCVDKTKSA